MTRLASAFAALVVFLSLTASAPAQTNSTPTELTLQQSIDLALRQNPTILKAQAELRRTHGLVVEAHSATLPQVAATSQYERLDSGAVDEFRIPITPTNVVHLSFANQQQPWNIQIEATQLIYAGGRVAAGIRSARLSDQIALLGYDSAVADTVLAVRKAFFQILLNKEQVIVNEQSIKLLEQQLEDARHRFDAGDVPRFNVLRAEVELANARPPLIRSQNDLRLGKESLVKLLAIDAPAEERRDFTPINFTGQLADEGRVWGLSQALTDALAKRPELQQAEKQTLIARADIESAQSGNRPELSLFGAYEVYDSQFANELSDTRDGWFIGARATWNIFDGQQTRGRVTQARARREQSDLDYADTRRSIELEVRQAFSDYLQARELLEAQKKTVEEADESLRLAEARFRAGTGTQLDVLSAQTALTQARSNEIEALYDYNVASATLERATGNTVRVKP
jgi:outer membrane protein TolC